MTEQNPALSIVIAVQYAQRNLEEIVQKLAVQAHPDVEFIFCYTNLDPGTKDIVPEADNVRLICVPEDSLIPHLWRDGILAAHHDNVAVTTAHCVPDSGWVGRLIQEDLVEYVGVGGVIDVVPKPDGKSAAIQILRYIAYASPQRARVVDEIAADNAVYRRGDIIRYHDLLQKGFWEPSFHARFRAEGLKLCIDPLLKVEHRNCYSARQFFLQRLAHGREFGLARAGNLSVLKRIFLVVLSPGLPILFLMKIMDRVRKKREYRPLMLRGLPWLLLFLAGWGMGEARGYLSSLVGTSRIGRTV